MITAKNYYSSTSAIDFSSLPESLKSGHAFFEKTTLKGSSWSAYETSPTIKKAIDLYLEQLNAYTPEKKVSAPQPKSTPSSRPKTATKKALPSSVKQPAEKVVLPKKQAPKAPLRIVKHAGQAVERISDEIRFIKRFLLMHGKKKDANQIRLFINALQRSIAEKRIRKTSAHATLIMEIQQALISHFESLKGKKLIQVAISDAKRSELMNAIGKQELMLSVRFIKSYISLQGKLISNTQAKNLHNRVAKALQDKRITQKDPYWTEVEDLLANLKSFVRKNSDQGILIVPTKELNGLNGILSASVGSLNGLNNIPDNMVVDSLDLVNMQFDKLNFTGKWGNFIGNPSRGFTAMVFGKPKFGKSFLCIDFAGYLAENHGKVLYIAREERIGDTIKEKFQETGVAHKNLQVVGNIPADLSEWDFIFLDSVTKLGLTPSDLEQLKANNPNCSFVFVFQTTKQGAFRGENGYQHDVDIVIEVPEIGYAIQYGRFNQGGEMNIFN